MSWWPGSVDHGWPAVGNGRSGTSKHVSTLTTPGTARASAVSIAVT